jgi:hypothetical protein
LAFTKNNISTTTITNKPQNIRLSLFSLIFRKEESKILKNSINNISPKPAKRCTLVAV